MTGALRGIAEYKCPECGCANIIHDYDSGETVCAGCGLVLEAVTLDTGPEWRMFTREKTGDRSRTGMPVQYSVHDKGLSTTIACVDYDASGKRLSQATRIQMLRLRKWQTYARACNSLDRNLAHAMTELDRLCDSLQIPQPVKENAAIIYRRVLEKGLVRGRSINAMVSAALYAACRSGNVPRTAKDIAGARMGERREAMKEVLHCYKQILKHLDLRVPVPDPIAHVSRIAEFLGISGKVQGRAIELLRMAREKRELLSKEPVGLAAAALYVACQQMGVDVTQEQIAGAAGVTEVTIRNRYSGLVESLKLDLPKRYRDPKKRWRLPYIQKLNFDANYWQHRPRV